MATYPNNYQRKKTIYWNDGSTARVLYPDEQDKQYRDYGNTAPKAEPVRCHNAGAMAAILFMNDLNDIGVFCLVLIRNFTGSIR